MNRRIALVVIGSVITTFAFSALSTQTVESTKATIDCSLLDSRSPITSEVPSKYNTCIQSITSDFTSTGDLVSVGHDEYKGKPWAMRRKTTVWKAAQCDYAVRTEFIWAGVPTAPLIDQQKNFPAKGSSTMLDGLVTQITVDSTGWAVRQLDEGDTKGSSTNGIVIIGRGYAPTPNKQTWDNTLTKWADDTALSGWSRISDASDSATAKIRSGIELTFREGYDQQNFDGSGPFNPRWVTYGQSVVQVKKVNTSRTACDSVLITTWYKRSVTAKNRVCADAGGGSFSAVVTGIGILVPGMAFVTSVALGVAAQVADIVSVNKGCRDRTSQIALQNLSIAP